MGRHEVAALPGAEGDLQQITGVQPQDGTPVRGEVTDLPKTRGDPAGGVGVRSVEEMVNLAGLLPPLVDRGDLRGQHESGCRPARRRQRPQDVSLKVGTQPEQTRLGRHELGGDLLRPGRVGEVTGADHCDALARRPPGQMLQVAVPAAGSGVLGVDVQVRKKA